LITDFPIILIAVLIFNRLSEFDLILAAISFAGGVYIAFLGIESIRIKEFSIDLQDSKTASIKKGIIANFLNPSPYLFWATVGVPLIFKAFQVNLLTSILFLISFYVLLIGSKVMIAFIVARTKVFMSQKIYVLVMRILGLVLLIFSLIFFYDGIKYL
jgi:threonine/homoserine/homoserine lactone efflux protein